MIVVLIGLLILILCILKPYKFSAILMFYYILFLCPIDSYAFYQLIWKGNYLVYSSSSLLLAGAYFNYLFYFFYYKNRFDKNIKIIISIANLTIFFIFFNSILKSNGFLYSFSTALYTGLMVCVIVPFMRVENNLIKWLIGIFLIKMALSILVIFSPDSFSIFDGANYQKDAGNFVREAEVNSSSLILDKAQVGSYGVFHNPNSLGFHSVIALALGSFLIFKKKISFKLIGILLFCLGVLGWINSLTRGPLLLWLFSLCFIYILKNKKSYMHINFALISLLLGILAFWFIFSDSLLNYLFPSEDNVSVTGRIVGYNVGFMAFMSSPILGINPNDLKWVNMEPPHLFFLYIAAYFGFIPAFLMSILIFSFFFKACHRAWINKNLNNIFGLPIMLLFILLGIALTNNFTAPMTFWALFMISMILIFQKVDIINVK